MGKNIKIMNKEELKKKYYQNKKVLDTILDNITLRRWKVLSKAYKQGKKIWGSRFTRERLAKDMGIPRTTVKRCLALDRVNKRTWRLIKEKKISVFKVAQICQCKSKNYQDEIVDLVIEGNLSTYQISSLKINSLKDINKERHRLACENGYSRQYSAYYCFNNWIERGKTFLVMDKKHLPEKKIPKLTRELKTLNKNINKYLK